MKITLIFPPYNHKIFEENLSTVDEEFGVLPPLNLLYVAAILENAGHEVQLIDSHALGWSMKKTEKAVRDFKPDAFGFMLTTYMFHQTLAWIQYFKREFRKPVLVGGINLEHYAKETFLYKEIDYGVIGDANITLPRLITAIEKNSKLDDIEGIVFRKDSELVITSSQVKKNNLEEMPLPARHLIPNEKYSSFISQKKNFTIMLSSRGCPFSCVFCVMADSGYHARSPKNVVDEIQHCYEKHGIREIDFFDPTLPLQKQRTLDICSEIIKRDLKINWSCRARIDCMDEDMLTAMADSGCSAVLYGIETADQQIADNMKKNLNLDKTYYVLEETQKRGMKTLGFFITGGVGETRESIKNTVKFAKNLPLDFAQFSRMIPKPMTQLDKMVQERTNQDYWREYVKGTVKEKWIGGFWTDLSFEDIEKLTKKAYWSFYFRPGIILRRILHLKSFNELLRYIKTALKMIFSYEYTWEDRKIHK